MGLSSRTWKPSNGGAPGFEKLSGRDRYRVRQGRYRILYSIDDEEVLVVVVKIGDRKDVCR